MSIVTTTCQWLDGHTVSKLGLCIAFLDLHVHGAQGDHVQFSLTLLEVQLAQLAFHKGQVCTCG